MTRLTEEELAVLLQKGNGQVKAPAGKRMRPWQQRESGVLKTCIAMLHVWGCDVVRCNTGMAWRESKLKSGQKKRYPIQFGKKGMGDIIGITPAGRWLEVETKSKDGVVRPEQKRRKEEVEAKNGLYLVVRSPEILESFKELILAESW